MSAKLKESRTRAPNFTKQDQMLLFESMKAYVHIIESKQTDAVKQADKQIAWAKITELYNSNTVGQSRTTDNLISCYRNVKSKIKKQHSEAKMMLVDPVQRSKLIAAIEENGKDWNKVASTSNWNNSQLCEQGFEEFKKEIQKEVNNKKKNVMATGGGPHQPDNTDDDLSEIKKLIEPQIDGLFTIYDSDAALMSQFQQTLPEPERMLPIEASTTELITNYKEPINLTVVEEQMGDYILETTPLKSKTRTEILRKKKEPALSGNETTSRKKSVSDGFRQLSDAKLELVKIQTLMLQKDFEHKQKIQQMEYEDLVKEKIFKERMREKELELMDLKIHNAKNI